MSTTAVSTGSLAVGTTTVLTGKATLNSIQLFGNGTNAPSVIVYDNTAASGKIVAQLVGVAATTYMDFVPRFPIRCDVGMTIVVAGTAATAIVAFGAT